VTHYISLHTSPYFESRHDGRPLPNADFYTEHLVRLPLYCGLSEPELNRVLAVVKAYFD
jgi:dTDP-4-amino-4,6-dideoxygalactose transaminase